MAFTGDMPQQAANSGAGVGHVIARGAYDVISHGRYHHDTLLKRQKGNTIQQKSEREKFWKANGLLPDPSPLEDLCPALDLILSRFPSTRPNLAASLGGLTLYDDLKQHIDQQLADIIQQSNASNARGSRKHEIAWNWFEPILREREARNRREWSERAVLTSHTPLRMERVGYMSAFQHFAVPDDWPQIQNPRTHLGSWSLSEHGRAAVMTPLVLRCHSKLEWFKKSYLEMAEKVLKSLLRRDSFSLSPSDMITYAYACIVRGISDSSKRQWLNPTTIAMGRSTIAARNCPVCLHFVGFSAEYGPLMHLMVLPGEKMHKTWKRWADKAAPGNLLLRKGHTAAVLTVRIRWCLGPHLPISISPIRDDSTPLSKPCE
ncbi:hypothetical protein V8E54_000332 [Elaphomyces granulatus]